MSIPTLAPKGDVNVGRGKPLNTGRRLRFLPLWFMAGIVLVTYAAIVWMLRRGFDWTDEAFVLNLTASNRETIGEPWGFQHLLHPLYVWTGQSVLALRSLRLAGYVLTSVALVWSAHSVVRRIGISIPRSGWVFILLLAQVGTFFAWSYPPQYLGYNELAGWFAQLGAALILLSLVWGVSPARSEGASRALWLIWAGLGSVLTLLVFAKATSGLSFAAILALAVVIPNPSLRLWKRVVSGAAGAALTLLVLGASGVPLGFYFRNMYGLLFSKSERNAFGRPVSGMVSTYMASLIQTGRAVLPALIVFALLVVTFCLTARPGTTRRTAEAAVGWAAWAFGALLIVTLVALPKPGVWLRLGFFVTFIGAAGIIGLAVLGADHVRAHRSEVGRSVWVSVVGGGVAVVAAPFIAAAGTSNPLTVQFVFDATAWAVTLGVALVLLGQRGSSLPGGAHSLPALIGCVVVLMAAFAVKDFIAKPYRTAPLRSQQTSTSVPELRGLLLTKADAAWIDWVSAAGDSLGAHDVPAIAIATRVPDGFTSSGALYAFNHSGYANPWLGVPWPAAFNSLKVACMKDPPTNLFVLQPGSSTAQASSTIGVTKSLVTCGIKFPGDFQVVDTYASTNPRFAMTIWRLKGGLANPVPGPAR